MGTLKQWERLARMDARDYRPPGRPRHSEEAHRRASDRVRAELERQGWSAGERPIRRALPDVPLRLVRSALSALKKEHRRRVRAERESHRTSTRAMARDTMWSIDATHLGRDEHGKIEAEVLREVASSRTLGLSVGPPATAREVVELLERARLERGAAPLVLVSDNGGAYTSAEVAAWLAEHEVAHLLNEPHTPQHNAWSEHGNGELKRETGLGKGVRLVSRRATLNELVRATRRLDHGRLRRSRGWRTAVDYDQSLPPASCVVERKRFYALCCKAVAEGVLDHASPRERRRAERAAILTTLERFGLVTMTGGGVLCSRKKPSIVS